MRTPNLQYLYLQKPITLIVFICMLSVLPWIGLTPFATKGEPREAAVAVSMINSDNWILPTTYADEFAYKPPMAHWLMAIFSLPKHEVTEFSSRLPSSIAFIVLIGFTLVFFGKRLKFHQAFIATLLLITCFEMHRAAMTTRVDMLLTTFIVLALYQLYRWEDELELKGLPIGISFLLSCSVLSKGPVGLILPLFVFFIYLLMLKKYKFWMIVKVLFYIAVSSLFLPLLWYIAAWKQGGEEFLNVFLAENFGRFFNLRMESINYNIGHENNIWYNFQTLITGFVPWTLLVLITLFGFNSYKLPKGNIKSIASNIWKNILSMEKEKLFSLVAIVCILLFYSIPASKRSVYLMPAYPFIAIFLAQYLLYITEYRTKATKLFAAILASLTSVIIICCVLIMSGSIDPVNIASQYTNNEAILEIITYITEAMSFQQRGTIIILAVLLLLLICVFVQMFKKINIKILYSTIALSFGLNMLIDGVITRSIRDGSTVRTFAKQIQEDYPLDSNNMFVMNNLLEYTNLYGLNFYLNNHFHNFETQQPECGYFFSTYEDYSKIVNKYDKSYTFKVLEKTPNIISDVNDKLVMSKFAKK